MAANENQTITSIIFRYLIQFHCVKINPNMNIENAFRSTPRLSPLHKTDHAEALEFIVAS